MISEGLNICASGMKSLIEMNDVIANNIANVNTNGFKKSDLTFRSILDAQVNQLKTNSDEKANTNEYRPIGTMSMGVEVNRLTNQFSQGNLQKTGQTFDLAIEGDGFFKVKDINGNISYTRNGNFMLNEKGILVDGYGNFVMDRLSKPISIDINEGNLRTKNNITITEEGIIEINNEGNKTVLQHIGVFDFQHKEDLLSLGGSNYKPSGEIINPEMKAQKYTIQQGMLESSNVNIIKEMVNIVNMSRSYETLSKFMKTKSDEISKAINLARV